jgi:hypothetical protein
VGHLTGVLPARPSDVDPLVPSQEIPAGSVSCSVPVRVEEGSHPTEEALKPATKDR